MKKNIKEVVSESQLLAMQKRMEQNCRRELGGAVGRRGGGGLMTSGSFVMMAALCESKELGQSEEAKDGDNQEKRTKGKTSIAKATVREELHTNGQ